MPTSPLTLTGTIYDAFDSPLKGITVNAFDKDLRKEQPLGSAVSNEAGKYKIEYRAPAINTAENWSADLFIRVSQAANGGSGVILGESSVFFNTPENHIIDLKIGSTRPYRGTSEFDALLAVIGPLLKDQGNSGGDLPLNELQEDDRINDIRFLSAETGLPEERIRFLRIAHQLELARGISPDIYYGLFRLLAVDNLEALMATRLSEIREALVNAIEQNIISAKWERDLDKIMAQIGSLATVQVLEGTPQARAYKTMLGSVLRNDDLQATFVRTYLESEAEPEKFWEVLKAQDGFADQEIINRLQTLTLINRFTGNIPTLSAQLFKEVQDEDAGKNGLRPLAKLRKQDWRTRLDMLGVTDVPAGIEGDDREQKLDNYATALESQIKALFPTAVFAARMRDDDDVVFGETKNDLLTFFINNPYFELNSNKINKDFAQAKIDGIVDPVKVKSELMRINRLSKLANNYQSVSELYKADIDSAATLVKRYSAPSFVSQFNVSFGGETVARKIYDTARHINNQSTILALQVLQQNDYRMFATNSDIEEVSNDYQSLFGSLNQCDCDECSSVYSPSAYLVDILNLLRKEPGDPPAQGNDNSESFVSVELKRRRPDLAHILLTCKNTNTALPFIDLVNEQLEARVAASSEADYQKLQTTLGAAELAAFPEHVNTIAYEALATAESSFRLPLNLQLEETRIYLEKLGISRVLLMEAFYGVKDHTKYDDLEIATEYLKLSKKEREIIVGGLIEIPSSNVLEFLDFTGLSYTDLLNLLECYFVNPLIPAGNRKVTIQGTSLKPDTCDVSLLMFAGVDADFRKRATILIRLWRKTGCDLFYLDKVLMSFGGAVDDKTTLTLSHIARLKERYAISIDQILTIWRPIGTVNYVSHSSTGDVIVPSLYDTLFKNKKRTNPLIADFNDPSTVSVDFTKHGDTLAAALGVTQRDLTALSSLLELSGELDLNTISQLYRTVTVSRLVRLAPEELFAGYKLTEIDPFATTSALLNFIEQCDLIRSSGMSWLELYRLLLPTPLLSEESVVPGNQYELSNTESIDTVLGLLQAGLKKIDKEFEFLVTAELPILPTAPTAEEKNEYNRIKKIKLSQDQSKLISQNSFISLSLDGVLKAEGKLISIFEKKLSEDLYGIDEIPNKHVIVDYVNPDFINHTGLFHNVENDGTVDWKFPKIVEDLENWIRITKFIRALKLTASELHYFRLYDEDVNLPSDIKLLWAHPKKNLYIPFSKLLHLVAFRNSLKSPDLTWYFLLEILKEPAENRSNFYELFSKLTQIESPESIFKSLDLKYPEDYQDGKFLAQVIGCADKIAKLGVAPEKVLLLTSPDTSPETAKLAQSLLKAKYDENNWLEVIKPISNQLRSRKRDALVAYLIGKGDFKDTSDLYAELLLDTEVAACMMTSRIKQAISSVQLFVDRCLMGLEYKNGTSEKLTVPDEFASQWKKWRKMYRVWEANRKVFLYPENWIEPDLRDDKSPFFKELESKLKQNEVTDEVAKEALLTYLEKLDSVANLEVVGFFPDESTGIVHVIGRTRNIPPIYYYRKQTQNAWSAWEKMDVDIEGDHILPVVWNNRLMVFWGMFTEKQVPNGGSTTIKSASGGSMSLSTDPAPQYFELKLAWSENKNGKWSPKKVTRKAISYETNCNIGVIDSNYHRFLKEELSLSSFINGSNLIIRPAFNIDDTNPNSKNQSETNRPGKIFYFDGCNSSPEIIDDTENYQVFTVTGLLQEMQIIPHHSNALNVYTYKGLFNDSESILQKITLLEKTPIPFAIMPLHHNKQKAKPKPFFYSNRRNNFYVRPQGTIRIPQSEDPFSVPSPQQESERPYSATFLVSQYRFVTFYHPWLCTFIRALNTNGIEGLYESSLTETFAQEILTPAEYAPTKYVSTPYPVETIDFSYTGSYSTYNWELFFHIPLLMATRLMQNQKFDEARKWFHYIFDPTKPATKTSDFWLTKPFKELIANEIPSIESMIETGGDDIASQLDYVANNPFNPHGLARLRLSAYMRTTVMKYIDNLVAWGDQLFQRDTLESINEATLLYVMAANLLGKRPVTVKPRTKPGESSFDMINKAKLDGFSNAKVEIESFLSVSDTIDPDTDQGLPMPLFCFPKNEKLFGYWDTVADRLFKIRNCMNIQGIVRQLPLFEPPIDPALLVRATAAGLDLNSVLNGDTAGISLYRFQVMLQKANELCNDVKSLGSELLSALEKQDAESLSLLRSNQEVEMLELMREIKLSQGDEAKENLDGLTRSKGVIEERRNYYASRQYRNASEELYSESNNLASAILERVAHGEILASLSYLLPEIKIGSGFTIGSTFGGINLGNEIAQASNALRSTANILNLEASIANNKGSQERRMDDWIFQAKTAELELKQIDKQIIAAEIRLSIAEKDLQNHDKQIENSKEIDNYLRSKFTNEELYNHLVNQLSTVYFQSYQLAYQLARKAERCYQFELGITPTTPYITFGYWDSLRKGLLSGVKLQYDLRRLENAYLEQNVREFELTKHISLALIDPWALQQLKATGTCHFKLEEAIFDLDFPGHYFRRIRAVSISIPCIAGPYSSVNATLRLESNKVRIKSVPTEPYKEKEDESDDRFISNNILCKAIATSNGQNDSGTFELNFRDERYLPFEYAGAESDWQLELSGKSGDIDFASFDFQTISDVVMHIRYTARDGGQELKSAVYTHIDESYLADNQTFTKVISMKNDFPNEWYELLNSPQVKLKLGAKDFPSIFRNKIITITKDQSDVEGKYFRAYSLGIVENIPGLVKSSSVSIPEPQENDLVFSRMQGDVVEIPITRQNALKDDESIIIKFDYTVSRQT